LRVDQPTITGRTRPAPDTYSPLFACDDCTFVDQFIARRLQASALFFLSRQASAGSSCSRVPQSHAQHCHPRPPGRGHSQHREPAGGIGGRRPQFRGDGLSSSHDHADDAWRRRDRRVERGAPSAWAAFGQADFRAQDLRQPGGHRHRKYPAAQ
jgi:hypothetical protein